MTRLEGLDSQSAVDWLVESGHLDPIVGVQLSRMIRNTDDILISKDDPLLPAVQLMALVQWYSPSLYLN